MEQELMRPEADATDNVKWLLSGKALYSTSIG